MIKLFPEPSEKKKQSIAAPVTGSLLIITAILMIVIIISLYYFSSIRFSMINFTEQAVQGIKNSSTLNEEVKYLLNETERLMGSTGNPERRIAYKGISERIETIKEIQNSKKFNDRDVKNHIEIIQSTLEELNMLIEEKINLQNKALEKIEELVSSMEGFEGLNNKVEWKNLILDDISYQLLSDWYIKTVEINRTGVSVFSENILYDINETEKTVKKQLAARDKITQQLPLYVRKFYQEFSEKQKLILIGKDGLLHIIKEKTRITLLATGRGNFTRTLLKDFIYISSNIFNRVVEYSEIQTDNLNKLVNSFFIIFGSVSFIAFLISVSVIIFIRKTLVHRIIKLNEIILEKVAGFDIDITIEGNDEITDMAKSFLYYENEVKKREAELNRIASIDFLTEINNRRHFIELAEKEIARSRRYKSPVTLLMIDIDFFKKINDTYGHHAGDKILVEFSSLCMKMIRENDIAGRIGGEEFAIMLPETCMDNGIIFADRLRKTVENTEWEIDNRKLKLTISIGASGCTCSTEHTIEDMMKKADNALYKAKESGRNKVCS